MRIKRAKIVSVIICCALLITALGNTVDSKAIYFSDSNDSLLKERSSEEYHLASDSDASIKDSYDIIEYNQNRYKVATGSNITEKYEQIWTLQDLMDINSDPKNMKKNYILMNDLDLGGMEWLPIACIQDRRGNYIAYNFSGIFNGNSHTISNFTIIEAKPRETINSIVNYGFFGKIQGGTVENLTLKNIKFSEIGKGFTGRYGGICGYLTKDITGGVIRNCNVYDITFENMVGSQDCVGGIAGRSEGTITGCVVDSTIENVGGDIGGIAGEAYGVISDCTSNVDINSHATAAGIATSDASITISNCINKGAIKAHRVGGILVGYKSTVTIQNCMNEGTLEGGTVGGIANFEYSDYLSSQRTTANIIKCGNKGRINVTENTIAPSGDAGGGIVGNNRGAKELKISQCYNIGDITTRRTYGTSDNTCGGILGFSNGSTLIEECFNAGTIESESGDSAGGIIGESRSADGSTEVIHCYNVGNVNSNEKGAIGSGIRNCKFVNCYYLNNINLAFYNDDQSTDVKKLSDEQMQNVSEYEDWDFDNIWTMGMDEYLYPVLKWMIEAPDMPEISDEDKPIEITDWSGWGGDTLYCDSDIIIEFSKGIYNNPGENCTDRLEVRDYVADQVLFTWDSDFNDYSIDGNTLIIHNALKECSEWEGQVLYLHIPDGFFRSADSKEDIVKGYTDKGKFSFMLGLSWESTLHYVQFKYEKNGEMILHYVQSVKDGELCPAIEGASWDGYEFVDWYEDEELTKKFDFTIPINRDYILYGKYVYRPSSNIESDSNNNTSSGSDSSSSSDSNIFEAKLRDSGFVNMSDGIWMVYKDGKPLTGYQENLYYNGEGGSFLFDENGFMLTGWHEVNGQLKYFDEVLGHRGYEIKPSFIADKVRRSSAYESLSKFNYAGTFAKDLNFLDATAFLICDYDDINNIVKRWLITGTNPINANDDWAQKHLKSILENLLKDENTPKYYSFKKDDKNDNEDSNDNVTDVVIPLLTSAGYETIADMIKYMQDAMGYTEDTVNAMFGSYASNISMLEQYKEICPEMSSAIDSLIHEYQNTVAVNLRKSAIDKLVEETNVKNFNDLYKELYTVEQGTIEEAKAMRLSSDELVKTLITTLFVNTLQDNVKDSSSVSNVEDVIYSAYPRNSAMKALSRAEQNLIANPNSYNAQNQYIAAFDFALESTKVQYWAMYEYYLKKGDTDVAQKIYDDYVKLSKMNFMNY